MQNFKWRKLLPAAIILVVMLFVGPPIAASLVRAGYASRIIDKPVEIVDSVGLVMLDSGNLELDRERLLTAVDLFNTESISQLVVGNDGKSEISVVQLVPGVYQNRVLEVQMPLELENRCAVLQSAVTAITDDRVIIAQKQALGRQLYLCNSTGVRTIGFVAASTDRTEDMFQELGAMIRTMQAVIL